MGCVPGIGLYDPILPIWLAVVCFGVLHVACCVVLSRTEPGCDYLTIFADETMSAVYGEQRYTGGKDGNPGNWPGLDGRPPLEIPAGHFFFRWTTDASVRWIPVALSLPWES